MNLADESAWCGKIGQLFDGEQASLHQVLEVLPVGAYTCDPDGLITYFNARAVAIWGRAPKLNDPGDRYSGAYQLRDGLGALLSHDACWMAQALNTGRSFSGEEVQFQWENGEVVQVLSHAQPLRNADGEIIGAVNILVDITPQMRAERSHAQLAAIVESSDDAIISKSLDGQILSWNEGAERIFGYSGEEAIGAPITMLIPPDRLTEEAAIIERLKSGERLDHFETIRRTKDGRLIDVSLTVSPVRDRTGKIFAASKIARDVTAQRQADAALATLNDELAVQLADLSRLHEMSTRLSTTFDVQQILEESLRTAAAIADTDLGLLALVEGDGQLANRASLGLEPAMQAATRQFPVGMGASGASVAERRRVVIPDIDLDGRYTAEQLDAGRRSGIRGVHSTPLISRTGEVLGVLTVYHRSAHTPTDRETRMIDLCARQAVDFIENARLYEQLRDSHRRKDEFLATLAHELRNPLAPISNSLQVLRMSAEFSPSLQRVREIMDQQVNHMVRLVDDLLEVSRITRGKIELRKEATDISRLVASAVEMTRSQIDDNRMELEIIMPAEPVVLDVDPVRMTQVIANLLGNAAKYTEPGGKIRLAAAETAEHLVLTVSDTGVGIPAEMIDQIFEMFSQVDRTLNRSRGGLGIGLTLAKSLVQLHGGTITARSEGPGKGSEFTVRLPVSRALSVSPLQITIDRGTALPPSRRILVVDDTRAAAYMLSKLLETLGQQVEHVSDAASGIDVALVMRPDIIFSDIAMPHMDGYELARRLRERPELKGVVLVAVTGFGQREDRERARAAGFDFHLVKPASIQSIRELLTSIPLRG